MTVVVKKAYRRLSLKVHPDRVGKKEKKAATCKFQVLGKVYSILSDKDKRAVYDETGMSCGAQSIKQAVAMQQ